MRALPYATLNAFCLWIYKLKTRMEQRSEKDKLPLLPSCLRRRLATPIESVN